MKIVDAIMKDLMTIMTQTPLVLDSLSLHGTSKFFGLFVAARFAYTRRIALSGLS
jgi:hypothetical protein